MCGIAAIVGPNLAPDDSAIRAMTAALAHRGPDQEGAHLYPRAQLGVRRLAVIDPATGAQPMFSEDGRIALVYNGEIFNYRELTAELRALGHQFRSRCDTEVLVHGYEQWGERVLDRLNGQFAFALWDGERLFCARDRLGEKPLYYALLGERLLIASEIKALLTQMETAPEIDESFWVYEAAVLGRTIFRGVRELPAAHALSFDGRAARLWRYWDLPAGPPASRPEDALADELRALLIDAVTRRLVADVPVGMFLSGGLDSAAIACIAKPDVAFSCHFPLGEAYDELRYAQLVAAQIGARHVVVQPTADDLRAKLPRLIWHLDQPIATASTVAEFALAEAAAAHGVKVLLGGQGADEIFAGYARYALMAGAAVDLASYRPLAAFLASRPAADDAAQRYFRMTARAAARDEAAYVEQLRPFFSPSRSAVDQMAAGDLALLLPSLLTMNDRACAAYGLENRCPFLDHRLVEFAFRLPPEMKLRNGTTKHLLRKALRGIVPDEILDRRDKKGLVVPFRRWLDGPLAAWADELEQSLAQRLTPPPPAGDRGEFDRRRYHRVSLELWFRQFFGEPPGPGVRA